jgi:hypothetical protein
MTEPGLAVLQRAPSGTRLREDGLGTGLRWLLVLVVPLAAALRCHAPPRFLEPADGSVVPASGAPVSIDLAEPLEPSARLRVLLGRALDEDRDWVDVTPLLVRDGSSITGTLPPGVLRPGRNRLVLELDRDGRGVRIPSAWSTFSFEPEVDVSDAARCDPLDRTRCLFPFPNDYFTVSDASTATGRRVRLARASMPANSRGSRVDPTRWNVLDGFSVGPMIVFQIPELDLEQTGAAPVTDLARSLDPDAPVVLLDAESGARKLLWVERDQNGPTRDEQPVIVRVGRNLPNGRRFVVALRHLRDAAGEPIPAPRVFQLYRDAIPTYLPEIEARRAHMEELFGILEQAGIPREELHLAWDFTTRSVESLAGKLLHMRDDAFARLGDAAPAFEVTSVEEPLDARVFRRVRGTFDVPLYLRDGGVPGSLLRFGPDGLPRTLGDVFEAPFECIVPWAATTEGGLPVHPARPALYGHGLLGSQGEVSAGNVRDMANEHDFVFCATKWAGMSEDDFQTAVRILQDFSQFPQFPDRMHQGLLAYLFLGRLMIHAEGFAGHEAFQLDGEPLVDPEELFYDGNSQGAILGGALAAIAQDFTRAVLGVPGMNFSTLLDRSVDFEDFNLLFRPNYPNHLDRQLLVSIAEMLWEETEVNGHAGHLTADPYPDTPPKKILLHMAYGDHQTANVSVEVEARTLGARLRTPAVDAAKPVPDVEPYYGIEPIESFPFDGSALVVWDSGNPPPPTGNVPPRIDPVDPEWALLSPCPQAFGGDPHECPRRQPEARLQKSEFLRTEGAVIDPCGPGPCLAP